MNNEQKKFQKSFTWDEFKKLSRLEKLSQLEKDDEHEQE